jgi:alpha-L-arabinofuranosidase
VIGVIAVTLALRHSGTAGGEQRSPAAASTANIPAEEVTVDVAKVLNTTGHHPLGLNVDYLMDDDRNQLLSPKRPLSEAVRELGSKFLRYPSGWKSAINLWSTPPYTNSRPALAGNVPETWLRAGIQLASPNGAWRLDPLDFDEFIHLCRAAQAEPCVVVPYESCHWEPRGEWRPPSRELLLETASAWVRYANLHKGSRVKYWEIGNESWLNNETWTNRITPETYATDLVEFARRMKAEDPAILIGANGDSDAWWQAVLSRAAGHIDFLSVHTYPCWKWPNYDHYRTNNPEPLGPVRVATNAIARYAPAHRQRLKVMLTEFAAGTFGDWDKTPADLGRALMTFDLQGQLLRCPEVYFSQFWNTHNIYSDVGGGVFDALNRDNTLTPIGRALWIWSRFLGEEMVFTSSGKSVRCFATQTAGRQLAVLLVNKETAPLPVRVTLARLPSNFTQGVKWVLHGSGPEDRRPVWEQTGDAKVLEGRIAVHLKPTSITVIALGPEPGGVR